MPGVGVVVVVVGRWVDYSGLVGSGGGKETLLHTVSGWK